MSGYSFYSWRHAILKSDLPPTTRHVLLTLSCHMNDAGESCYPSVELLATETGLSSRAVITHLNIAREAGWIVVDKHGFRGQKWNRNDYKMAWPDVPIRDADQPGNGQKAVNDVHGLSEKAVNVVHVKAVNDVHLYKEELSSINATDGVTNVTPGRSNPQDLFGDVQTEQPAKAEQVEFDAQAGRFVCITEERFSGWDRAYPKIDVDAELEKAEQWYQANPRKRKRNHLRFLVGWFARANQQAEQIAHNQQSAKARPASPGPIGAAYKPFPGLVH